MGVVYLVGGGPGDPGLLTVRAAKLLRRADVIVHDALVNERLLDLAPRTAERINAGKRGGQRNISQAEINRSLIEAASRAAVVVRLKGGDPFIFGRGGEEAAALAAAGIQFEIVPGVTAAAGAAACAGIPLTHRSAASELTFVTGHEDPAKTGSGVSWDLLARGKGTIVIYMGIRALPDIVDRLLRAGRAPDTPAAVVEWATQPFQRTVTAPLSEIASRVAAAGLGAPSIVVIGDVVALREPLRWFERRPLFGTRLLVPRSRPQASRLAERLASLGAEVIEFPRIDELPARDRKPLVHALRSLSTYDWIVFTSSTAVTRFWEEWCAEGLDARALAGIRIACFGEATAKRLRRRGIRADVAASTYRPGVAVNALRRRGAGRRAQRVLFPGNADGESAIAARLRDDGFRVDEVEVYSQVTQTDGAAQMRNRLRAGDIDAVVFTSSGTVRAFADSIGATAGRARIVTIGPRTTQTAEAAGLRVDVVAEHSSIEGLIAELLVGSERPDLHMAVERRNHERARIDASVRGLSASPTPSPR